MSKPGQKEPPKQVLPAKEASLFKQIVKFYESKQYKKALRNADTILKKYPQHGETLAMKGLLLYFLKKKDEAEPLIKQGLAFNVNSHICWHVYGLYYRANHEYDKSIKCYQNATRIDPNNLQILKDLSLLQVQRRMMDGFQETRRKILLLKPNNKQNWLGYAVGQHLCKRYKSALDILDRFEKTIPRIQGGDKKPDVAYEDSELLLYRNLVIEESGDLEGALEHLDEIEDEVVDKLTWRQRKTDILVKLGRLSAAEEEARELLDVNPNNTNYHYQLRSVLGLQPKNGENYTSDQVAKLTTLYEELAKQYPTCSAVERLPLDFLSGEAFKPRISAYLRKKLKDGVPSLFRDLRDLCKDQKKADIIEAVAIDYRQQLQAHNRFTTGDAIDSESPVTFQWLLVFLGCFYDYFGLQQKALDIVEEAIRHTPTHVDLYVLKARIYKHAGDHQTAFNTMEYARKLDTQDRYLNTKTVRYALRADRLEEAEQIVSLFLRDGENITSLYEMQCSWYELGLADSFLRKKDYGRALKKYGAIDEHLDTMYEDQFDFHTYCLRKQTIRAYIDLIRWEDNLRGHRFYNRAAKGIIKTYLTLADAPTVEEKEKDPKKKKEARKAKKEQEAAEVAGDKKKLVDRLGKPNDPDPLGELLVKTKDPLGDAIRHVKNLSQFSPNDVEGHILAAEVYLRKKKWLLAARSLKHANKASPHHPSIVVPLVTFLAQIESAKDLNATVKTVLDAERKDGALGGGKSALELTNLFIKNHSNTLAYRLAGAKAWLVTHPEDSKKAVELAFSTLDKVAKPHVKDAIDTFEFLKSKDEGIANKFKADAARLFPLTPAFQSPKEE